MEKYFLFKALLIFLIIGDYEICTAGMVILSPTSVAPVCQVGDPLELTCNSTGSFIRWAFTVGNEQGAPQEYQRIINSQDVSQQISITVVNSATFTFMRTSDQGILPLVSTLVIDSVNIHLNGTEVHCLDVATSTNASTTIRLFDMKHCTTTTISNTLSYDTEDGRDTITISGSTTQIYSGGSTTQTYSGGSTTQTYSGGSTTQTYSGGSTTQTYSGGSTMQTYSTCIFIELCLVLVMATLYV